MTFENILYELQGPMALITINRADKHNAISLATLDDLQTAVAQAAVDDDVRVILFVMLRDGVTLDDDLQDRIRKQIRANCTPRHVPARIVHVADIPRTKSGKITELAVRDMVHGRAIKNQEALANPEALDLYRDIPELRE